MSTHFFKTISTLLLFLCAKGILAQQDTLKVHFLYGSKPKKAHRDTEFKYFGGIHGGHVTFEIDSVDYGFGPSGGFHVFPRTAKKHRHSGYAHYSTEGRLHYIEGAKYVTFYIPITPEQKAKGLEVTRGYCQQSPYDYAFLGMRCAASARDVLGHMGIMKKCSRFNYIFGTFYPKKLRKRLFRQARKKGYKMVQQEGRPQRKWESD